MLAHLKMSVNQKVSPPYCGWVYSKEINPCKCLGTLVTWLSICHLFRSLPLPGFLSGQLGISTWANITAKDEWYSLCNLYTNTNKHTYSIFKLAGFNLGTEFYVLSCVYHLQCLLKLAAYVFFCRGLGFVIKERSLYNNLVTKNKVTI